MIEKQTNWFNEQIQSTLKQLDVNSLEAIYFNLKDILENKNSELIHFLLNLKKGVTKNWCLYI